MTPYNDGKVRAREIPALRVRQWLAEWNNVDFKQEEHRRRPEPHFYLFSLSAIDLLSLSAISRRSTEDRALGIPDLGIQRRHDPERSQDIHDFVKFGYPWSEMSASKRASGRFKDLQKPGWLPTAIVVNFLRKEDERRGVSVADDDLVRVVDSIESYSTILMPEKWSQNPDWRPERLAPVEVIDGQHRLLAFEDAEDPIDIELPVVAFNGLDISWQAYLFWTINIRPKRINPSLAFDLYPLLRTESWLDADEGHSIYRETRAQELTEAMWAHPASAWYHRINMLGDSGRGGVTQAAWVRSLGASYVKPWEGPRIRIGGLFGDPVRPSNEALPWSRVQQAAFLILLWQLLAEAVGASEEAWAERLRTAHPGRRKDARNRDAAFAGPQTLLNTDQGVRGVLQVSNDLCYVKAADLRLDQWRFDEIDSGAGERLVNETSVTAALNSLRPEPVERFLSRLANAMATYDWRTAAADGLTERERVTKLGFRGSGGYKELRRQLLLHLAATAGDVGEAAREVRTVLGY